MAHQVHWTKRTTEEFIREGMLTEEEQQILLSRIAGMTRTQQAMEFNMSLSKVDRIIDRLKKKYDAIQAYDPLLPKRRTSAQEIYMDEN